MQAPKDCKNRVVHSVGGGNPRPATPSPASQVLRVSQLWTARNLFYHAKLSFENCVRQSV